MTISHVTELLSPAGSLKNMRYAFAYGADAVYAGQPRYSLRVRNNEFDHDNLAIGIQEAHELGKKFYVVVNIQPHNSKLKNFIRDLEPVVAMQPDALIMSDPGLIMMVRENFPDMPVHLSVQANAVNWATVKFWQNMGLTRVILSRELSIDEIEEIKNNVPGMEIEVFVHGALCMAYSGRCMLSGYMNKRDANQGACTNACRWEYKIHDAKEDETGDVIPVKNLSETANADEQYVYASELKLLAAVSAQQLDVILMDTAARDQLQDEEYFLDLRTLDADFSSLDELSADGVTLDISDTPLIAQAGFEESVYLGVIANAPHPERAAAYIRYLLK